jgi:low affinity Fe/Cu permease
MISQATDEADQGFLCRLNHRLERFSRMVTHWAGSSWAFAIALGTVVLWAVSGPIFSFSETWQLVINTGTTIVTFLLVFLIQRAQNKDALAIQVKLNELLASQQGASNRLINVEDWGEDEVVALHKRFNELSQKLSETERDGEVHSIREAREAVEDARESLQEAGERAAKRGDAEKQRNANGGER